MMFMAYRHLLMNLDWFRVLRQRSAPETWGVMVRQQKASLTLASKIESSVKHSKVKPTSRREYDSPNVIFPARYDRNDGHTSMMLAITPQEWEEKAFQLLLTVLEEREYTQHKGWKERYNCLSPRPYPSQPTAFGAKSGTPLRYFPLPPSSRCPGQK